MIQETRPQESGGQALARLGQTLAAKRQERGLTLADVEAAIKVRRSYLEALENGAPECLPGPVYQVGFTRAYAEFLGLDGLEFSRLCRAALTLVPPAALSGGTKDVTRPPGERASAGRVPRRGGLRLDRRHLLLLFLLLVVLLVVLAPRLWRLAVPRPLRDGSAGGGSGPGSSGGGGSPSGSPPAASTAPAPEPAGEPRFAKSDLLLVEETEGLVRYEVRAARLGLALSLEERVWLRVTADGRIVFEGARESGSEMSFEATERLELRVGRASMIRLSVLGLEPETAGLLDGPRTVIFLRRQ